MSGNRPDARTSDAHLDARISDATEAALPAIILEARRAAAALVVGTHSKRRAGAGDAFWQHREWSNGESVRQIDWRRSARSDRLFVREREWQVPAHLQIWCDQRPTMDWHSTPTLPTKAQRGLVIGLALGIAARAGGERVSALTPSTNKNARTTANEIALARALHSAGLNPPKTCGPGWALIISDGLESPDVWDSRMRALTSQGASVLVVLVADPAEHEFPFQGRVAFQSDDQGQPFIVGRAQTIRLDYQVAYTAHIGAVRDAITRAGGRVFTDVSDRNISPLLLVLAGELSGTPAPLAGSAS
jgi:uncharacterized protein (DUF58 family)